MRSSTLYRAVDVSSSRTRIARALAALAATAAIGIAGLVAAPAASAVSGTVTDNGNGSATLSWSGMASGDYATFNICAAGSTACVTTVGATNSWYWSTNGLSGSKTIAGGTTVISRAGGPVPLPEGTYRFEIGYLSGNTLTIITSNPSIQITNPVTPPAESSASAAAPAPAALTFSVDAGSAGGAVCKAGSSATGYTGDWLALPGQGDCSLPSKPGATLLGWSTSVDFPVAIAQRQASNGWGTYEQTDADGNVTAVFIPAGWSALVTGNNTLHPIWSA